MTDSTIAKSRRKSTKLPKEWRRQMGLHPQFPLFPHQSGRWCKKVRQKLHYFGKIADDPKGAAALLKWAAEKDALIAGYTPRAEGGGLTVEDLCDHFLNAKKAVVVTGELTKRTYDEYFATCERLTKTFGLSRLVDDLRPDDFDKLRADVAKVWGPVRLGNEIQRVRTVFKFGFEAGHIDRPVRFGPAFKKPSRKTLRKERAKKGPRMFEAAALRTIIQEAGVQMRAMIHLGLNCGFGNTDCALLPLSALDLKGGWVNYPRPKTGVERRCPLWPETVKALKAALDKRRQPKDTSHAKLVFITKYGSSWAAEAEGGAVAKEFRKLLNELNLHRPGLGFYTLRHVMATIGGEARDQVAVNAIMGHVDPTMAGAYRERIDDERLVAVSEHVRKWLFAKKANQSQSRSSFRAT